MSQPVWCPVFTPSRKDFQRPFMDYVNDIFKKNPDIPMFKVIPPAGWRARRSKFPDLADVKINTPIKQHVFGGKGAYRCIFVEQKEMSVKDFKRIADEEWSNAAPAIEAKQKRAQGADVTEDSLIERCFWSSVTLNPPLYGADTPVSFFDKQLPYGWNLNDLGDLLKTQNVPEVPGVTTPMTYFGMWRSFFGWHKEDADLLSVNYMHFGAPKVWYTISPKDSAKFERMASGLFPQQYRTCRAFIRHKDIMISPSLLRAHGIPFMQAKQAPGEFMVLNAAAYHSGYNMGFNCAEAVNFANEAWIDVGKAAYPCRCDALKDCVRISMKLFDPDWVDPFASDSEEDDSSDDSSQTEESEEEEEEEAHVCGKGCKHTRQPAKGHGSKASAAKAAPAKRGRPPAAKTPATGSKRGRQASESEEASEDGSSGEEEASNKQAAAKKAAAKRKAPGSEPPPPPLLPPPRPRPGGREGTRAAVAASKRQRMAPKRLMGYFSESEQKQQQQQQQQQLQQQQRASVAQKLVAKAKARARGSSSTPTATAATTSSTAAAAAAQEALTAAAATAAAVLNSVAKRPVRAAKLKAAEVVAAVASGTQIIHGGEADTSAKADAAAAKQPVATKPSKGAVSKAVSKAAPKATAAAAAADGGAVKRTSARGPQAIKRARSSEPEAASSGPASAAGAAHGVDGEAGGAILRAGLTHAMLRRAERDAKQAAADAAAAEGRQLHLAGGGADDSHSSGSEGAAVVIDEDGVPAGAAVRGGRGQQQQDGDGAVGEPAAIVGEDARGQKFFCLVQRLKRAAPTKGCVLLRWLKEGKDGLYRAAASPSSCWEERPASLVSVRTQLIAGEGRRPDAWKLLTLRSKILDTELVDA